MQHSSIRIALLFSALVAVSCSGVWSVGYYFNQDGSPHLYNAYLILELLKGNDAISQFAAFNAHLVPNLTGHWLLAFLLIFFAPATVTKIMVTFTFASFIASVGWLRSQVAGREGLGTAMLLGTVLAFNWLWFLGFYNFMLASASFAFTLGLWWRWRKELRPGRALILFLLFAFTFYSHLIVFGFLLVATGFLFAVNYKSVPRKSILWAIAVFLAIAPLLFTHLYWNHSGDALVPEWTYLKSPLSIANWVSHLSAADPFSLISRKAAPFVEYTTPVFALFSSFLWLAAALMLLIVGTLGFMKSEDRAIRSGRVAWLILAFIFLGIWLVGPDSFGKVHGGFLRERTLLLALVCFVPFFCVSNSRVVRTATHLSLAFIIIFQTLVVWEYAHFAENIGMPFVAAKQHIDQNESVGSVIFMNGTRRFRPAPLSNISSLLGVQKNGAMWDNFEFGHYIFPVSAKDPAGRQFVFDFRESNTYDMDGANENMAERLASLESVLTTDHQRIDVLLVWNAPANAIGFVQKWFESEPYFESQKLKLFRHRPS